MLSLRRPAGSATIHPGHVAHAVTLLRSGVRYGLFFFTYQRSKQPFLERYARFGQLPVPLPKQRSFDEAPSMKHLLLTKRQDAADEERLREYKGHFRLVMLEVRQPDLGWRLSERH